MNNDGLGDPFLDAFSKDFLQGVLLTDFVRMLNDFFLFRLCVSIGIYNGNYVFQLSRKARTNIKTESTTHETVINLEAQKENEKRSNQEELPG